MKFNSGKVYLATQAYQNGLIDDLDLETVIRDHIDISEVIINPASGCNLRCTHCSYAMQTDDSQMAPIASLKRFMGEAKDDGVELAVFLGMEPLLDYARTGELVSFANSIGLDVGLVTNGTLAARTIDRMKDHRFLYIDVSLDGSKEGHDLNRGRGTFDKSIQGLDIFLASGISKKVNVSATLMAYNEDSIVEMIETVGQMGVSYVNVGLYIRTNKNPADLSINLDSLESFISRANKLVGDTMSVNIDVFPHMYAYWNKLIEQGTLDNGSIFLDEYGRVSAPVHGAHPHLTVRNAGMSRLVEAMIVTPEGMILDDYETVARKDYLKYTIGDIQSASFRELVDTMRKVSPSRAVHKIKTILERGMTYDFLKRDPLQPIETIVTYRALE